MNTCVIACRTIEDELSCAMVACGTVLPVLWLESGLHNVPKRLHTKLQNTIEEAEKAGYTRLLLAMGYCGNSVEHIVLDSAELIMPRVDDCITLLLGSYKRRKSLEAGTGTYFMTKGWLRGERNIWKEYEYAVEKYGKETGEEIFDMMFGNYSRIGILDTKSCPIGPVLEETEIIAKELHLSYEVFDASYDYIIRLLTGPWDNEHFLKVNRGSEICFSDLTLMEE